MLRLRDAGTGEPREFIGRFPMRIHVCGGGLRAMLTADLIRRVRTVVDDRAPVVTSSDPDADSLADWNIHPPVAASTADRAPDIVIDGEATGCRQGEVAACTLNVGPAQLNAHADPLVLRLAALEIHYAEPARLDQGRAAAAEAALRGWRAAVSAWATAPGAAMSMPYVHRLAAAFEDDLATPQALQVLGDLENDESVSAGAKFETFAYADRLLGVDLARDVGR